MAEIVPFIRVTHSGLYADGRANTSSIFLTDVNFGFDNQNRKAQAYVPAGGFIDLPYTSESAFSFQQGDICKFTMAGLVTSEIIGLVPPVGTNQSYYEDDPGSLGSGTRAESYSVLLPDNTVGTLAKVTVRVEIPAAVGESASLAIFRFRKLSPTTTLFVDRITDTFVLDSTAPWSWTIDISANIRPGYSLDPFTDSLAISNVYVAGGGPTIRALRVDMRVETQPDFGEELGDEVPATPVAGPDWPPA